MGLIYDPKKLPRIMTVRSIGAGYYIKHVCLLGCVVLGLILFIS
jgi:hypothetical protein